MRGNTPDGRSIAQPQYTEASKWSRQFRSEYVLTPPVVALGKVYFATIDDNGKFRVYALNGSSGEIVWLKVVDKTYSNVGSILSDYKSPPAISTTLGVFYVKDPEGYIRAYKLQSGVTPSGWRNADTYGSIRSGIIIVGNKILTGADPTAPGLAVYSAVTGSILQSYAFTYLITCDGLPSADGNIVFLKMADDYLYGVDLSLHESFYGGPDWVISEIVVTDPIIDGTKIYYVRDGRGRDKVVAKMVMYDGSTVELWSSLVGDIATMLAMDNAGRIFTVTKNGKIVIIKDGNLIKSISTGLSAKSGMNIIVIGDIVYFVSSDQRLVAVDYVESKVVKTWSFSGEPLGIALGNGMVYVSTRGGIYGYPVLGKTKIEVDVEPPDIDIGISINSESAKAVDGIIKHDIWTEKPIDVELVAPHGVVKGDVKYAKPTWTYDSNVVKSEKITLYDVKPWASLKLELAYEKYLKATIIVWIKPSSLKDAVLINGSSENPKTFWLAEGSKENITIYAMPSLPYNATHYYRFAGWSDCNCSNMRFVEIRAGDTLELTVSYELVRGKSITVDLSPYGYGHVDELVKLVESDEPEKISESVGDNYVMYYSVGAKWLTIEAAKLYYINETTRLRFKYWLIGNSTINSTKVTVQFNNQVIKLSYAIERLYELRIEANINPVALRLENGTVITANCKLVEWSEGPASLTVYAPTIVQINESTRAVYIGYSSDGAVISSSSRSDVVRFSIIPTELKSTVKFEYRYEYKTVLTIFSTIKDVVIVNNTALNWTGGFEDGWVVILSEWRSEPLTYVLYAEDYVKVDHSGFYKFIGWSDGVSNATRIIVLQPGDNVALKANYKYDKYITGGNTISVRDLLLLASLVFTGAALTLVARRFSR